MLMIRDVTIMEKISMMSILNIIKFHVASDRH